MITNEIVTPSSLEGDISLNYRRLMEESQERKRGQLICPLAKLFEARMNTALEEWHSIQEFTGQAAMLGETSERQAA